MSYCLQKHSIRVAIVVIIYLSAISTLTSADTYYIIPTPNHPLCPEGDVPCITLSQYAKKLKTHEPSQNESLIILPGNHTLDQKLSISGITHFQLFTEYKYSNGSSYSSTWIICSKAGHFTFKNISSMYMRGFTADRCGVNVLAFINSVTLEKCTFQRVNTKLTGRYTGFYIKNVANMRIKESSFISNNGVRLIKTTSKKVEPGGALYIANSNIFIESSYFKNNTAYYDTNISDYEWIGSGGAIAVRRSRLHINNSIFIYNFASSFGGAIHGFRGSTIIIHNSIGLSNMALDRGGFAFIYDSSRIGTINSVFTSNIAAFSSGVLHAEYFSSVTIYNSSFSKNQAYVYAGVLYADYYTTVDIKSSKFYSNKALPYKHAPENESHEETAGGVMILLWGSTVIIVDSAFIDNIAGNYAGVIGTGKDNRYHQNDSDNCEVIIYNCTFIANRANGGGGESKFNVLLNASKIAEAGGVLWIVDSSIIIESSYFENNTAYYDTNTTGYELVGSGGAIVVQRSGLYINNTIFSYNVASTDGGVIYGLENSTIIIFNSNGFSNMALGRGGFAFIYDSSRIATINSVFTSNIAAFSCGVLHAEYFSSVTIYNSTFSENQAYVQAGVLYADYYTTVDINSTKFYNNKALPNTHAPKNESQTKTGGGVMILLGGSKAKIVNSRFSNNTAGKYAGVIGIGKTGQSSDNCEVTVYNCTFIANRAGYGVNDGGDWVVFANYNKAIQNSGFGGVVYANTNVKLTIQYSYFALNIAVNIIGKGGVIYIDQNGTVVLKGNVFQNNSAYDGAGVLCIFNSNVIMENCSFSNNSAGVMYIDKTDVAIDKCSFTCNLAKGSGVGYITNGVIRITNSMFQQNMGSTAGFDLDYSTLTVYDSAFISNYGNYNGGVLNMFNSVVKMEKCSFFNNYAPWGGVIYCTNSKQIAHGTVENVKLINDKFLHNSACTGSVLYSYLCSVTSQGSLVMKQNQGTGVIYLTQSNATFLGRSKTISNNIGSIFAFASKIIFNGTVVMKSNIEGKYSQLYRCHMIANVKDQRYQEGGAITAVKSDVRFLGNVTIITNKADIGGGLLAIQSNIDILDGTTIISSNTAAISGGGFYAYQSQVNFNGKTLISNNKAANDGGGIHAIASILQFTNGTHHVSRNKAGINGGGMYLELDSKVIITKDICNTLEILQQRELFTDPCFENSTEWIAIQFESNIAQYGGAICVNDDTSCSSSTTNANNPTQECFFQTLSMYWNVSPWPYPYANNTYFINNHANKAGNVLYGGLLDRCSLSPFVVWFVNMTNMSAITYLHKITNIQIDSIQSQPVRVCFCSSYQIPDCGFTLPTIHVKKGETFTVSLVAVDQVNHTLPAVIHSSLSSQSSGLKEGEMIQSTTKNCTHLNYTIFSLHTSEQLNLYAEGPCKDIGISSQSIDIKFIPCDFCPTGFKIPESSCVCECDPQLKPLIIQCFNTNGTLLKEGEFWIDYVTHNNSNKSGYLIYPHCPFHYCYPPTTRVYIDLSTPNGSDTQCSFNRSKLLCGQCKPGHSLSLGSTHCRPCSNYWLLLLIPFAIAGILLVALILKLNLTVAEGTLNGLIFYANIVVTNSDIFLPFESSNFVTVFISWINLDFGIETCFYNGMDAYAKTWLQFVFPLYIILLVTAIIVISDYSPRFARLFTTSTNPVAALATLILLSHAKLLRTIITALSFTQLKYPDGSHKIVWLLDANVPYLRGKHIPLFIAAVLTALVGLVYSFFLFSWQWVTKYSKKTFLLKWMTNAKILAFIDVYHAPYNPKHRYWTGLMLLARTILYLVFAVNVLGDPRVNLLCITSIGSILILGQKLLLQRIYKSYFLDIIENIFIINLVLFASTTFYLLDAKKNRAVLAYISTSTALLMFTAFLIYYTYKFTKAKLNRCRCKANRYEEQDTELQNVIDNEPDQVILLTDEGSCTEIDIRDFSYNNDTDDSNDIHGSDSVGSGDRNSFLVTADSANYAGDDEDSSCDETKPLLDNKI